MLYYYQDTHYLPSGPPQTMITDEDIAKSRDLRRIVKFLGPSIRTIQPCKKKYYSYHVYEEMDHFLYLLGMVDSENEINAEEIKTRIRPGSDSEEIRELSSTFDYRILWKTAQTEFRMWTSHRQKWQQEHRYVDGEDVTINYKSQFDKRIEATSESLKVFRWLSMKEYNPRDYKVLYNWLGKWKCYSGLAIGDRHGHEKKLLSLWNTEHCLSALGYDSWLDLDDDLYWTRKVGVELAKILDIEWKDKFIQCSENV